MKNYLIALIIFFGAWTMKAQSKYTGVDTDCDNNLMPLPNTYKILFDTTQVEGKRIYSNNFTLPCDTYYMIREKYNNNNNSDTIYWRYSRYIIIIYPKQ